MQSTKNIIKGMLFASFVLAFLFTPKALAADDEAYTCNLLYSSQDTCGPSAADCRQGDTLQPFTYGSEPNQKNCCYPVSPDKEPFQGISCRPEGQFMMMSPTRCVTPQSILDIAADARFQNKISFNCKTGAISSLCRTGYCPKPDDGKCIAQTGAECPVDKYRGGYCPGGCGACGPGPDPLNSNLKVQYVWCDANNPLIMGGTTQACVPPKDRPTGATKSCKELGKNVLDPCTGVCSNCPDGSVPSGQYPGTCVSYAQRFKEILDFGLSFLGGLPLEIGETNINNAYSYGSLKDKPQSNDPSKSSFYGNMFVEVDQADHLNWSSLTVPAVIQSMIVNAGYQFCGTGGSCPSGQICTAGICNKPDAGTGTSDPGDVGQACANSSECHLGLLCDPKTLRCYNPVTPENELVSCTADSQCTGTVNGINLSSLGATSCVLGYCRNPNNPLGSTCNSGSDSECSAGLICNASKICVLASDTTSRFVGLTGTAVNGGQTDYKNADKLCSDVYDGGHVCWSKEIVASYLANVPTIIAPNGVTTGFAWINAAAPGNQFPLVNDCNGWNMSTPDSDIYGTIWNFNGKNAGIAPCEMPFKFACCK